MEVITTYPVRPRMKGNIMGRHKHSFTWSSLDWHYPPTSFDIRILIDGTDIPVGAISTNSISELSILRSFCDRQIHRIRTQQYAFARMMNWDVDNFPPEYVKADRQVRELDRVRFRVEKLLLELRK